MCCCFRIIKKNCDINEDISKDAEKKKQLTPHLHTTVSHTRKNTPKSCHIKSIQFYMPNMHMRNLQNSEDTVCVCFIWDKARSGI